MPLNVSGAWHDPELTLLLAQVVEKLLLSFGELDGGGHVNSVRSNKIALQIFFSPNPCLPNFGDKARL